MWNRSLLIGIWVVEIPFLIYDAIVGIVVAAISLVSAARYNFQQRLIDSLLRGGLGILSLVFIFAEISRYRRRRLHPRFFVISQNLRIPICVYALYTLAKLYRGPYPYVNYAPLYKAIVLTLAHCVGVVYGAWIWWQQRKLGHADFDAQSRSIRLDQQLMLPSKINQAAKLKSKHYRIASIVHWIYRPLFHPAQSRPIHDFINHFSTVIKWIPGVIALIPTVTFSSRLGSEPKKDQVFENLDFDNWNYLKPYTGAEDVSSPILRTSHVSLEPIPHEPVPGRRSRFALRHANMPERLLGPRYLCYLDDTKPRGYNTMTTRDRASTEGNNSTPNYVFISYTRRQFYTQIIGDPTLPAEQNERLQRAADRDTDALICFAVRAAKAAGVEAFWIDFECVQPEDDEQADDSMEDVYRICDIVRAAYSLVIITGPPVQLNGLHNNNSSAGNKAEWLHEWGKRLWTVPEALLCSSEHRIAVYAVGTDEPEMVARRNLASLVWDDAGTLRQLVDHYESSIHLTQLELISIALECLQRRQTEKRMSGDVAYALMGLLRQRPRVNKQDSGFQAFARLSLANDSDMLLERLICLKSIEDDAPWHDMTDSWNARLWDIHPLCQISDVVDEDTIILGGAQGSVVNWSYLNPIDYSVGSSRKYSWHYVRQGPVMCTAFAAVFLMFFMFWFLVTANIDVEDSGRYKVLIALSICIGIPWIISVFLSMFTPSILRRLFSQRVEDTQARFFGIEGQPELEEVERILFGRDRGRIRWIPDEDPERRLQHPEQMWPPVSPPNGDRRFTLIDTLTLSAVVITAKRPPNVVMACGRERGFVRAILCSYESDSNTLIKEGTLRMKMTVLDRMPQMDMVRFRLVSDQEYSDSIEEG